MSGHSRKENRPSLTNIQPSELDGGDECWVRGHGKKPVRSLTPSPERGPMYDDVDPLVARAERIVMQALSKRTFLTDSARLEWEATYFG